MPKNDKPIGSRSAGYAKQEEGPFRCDRCVHYDAGYCDHPEVKKDAEAGEIPKDKKGAVVEPGGCCTYFRPSPRSEIGLAIMGSLGSMGKKKK